MAKLNLDPNKFVLESVSIWKVGEDFGKPYANLMEYMVSFQYFEDILSPSISGILVIHDSGENLPSTMPIQGFERVSIVVKDYKDTKHQYDFRVWKVSSRVEIDSRKQGYALGLISEKALVNEGVKVNKVLSGPVNVVVKKLLTEYLNVSESSIDSQETINAVKIIPASKSPFAVIRDLQPKAIAKSSTKTKSPAPPNLSKTSSGAGANVVSKSDYDNQAASAKGTAGYFFFETRDGFKFKSIDTLSSANPNKFGGSAPVATYYYKPALIEKTSIENNRKIQEIVFRNELDIMKKLREGTFSSVCAFFNINTGKYEEYLYKLSDMWDNMAHLGSQTQLPYGQKQLSQYPTRRLSTIINHENWYNGTGIASNDANDSGDSKSQYPDYQKQFLSQSIARAGILFNQTLLITIAGNLDLRVGDKIEVMIPNTGPSKKKDKLGSFDPEHSGIYLIKKINHQFLRTDSTVNSVLELVRDSYGILDGESNTK